MDSREIVFTAAKRGHLNTLKTYLSRRTEDEVQRLISASTDGCTPLAVACENGHVAVVDYLLDVGGVDIERGGDDDAPAPLWFATRKGHLDVVHSLLTRGAAINCRRPWCPTPLIEACKSGDLRLVEQLVDRGADVGAADDEGATALMLACHRGHHHVARHLILHGADVTQTDKHGVTALHYSVIAKQLACIRLLLSHGAEIDEISPKLIPLLLARRTALDPPRHAYLIIIPFCTRFPLGNLESLRASYVDIFPQHRFPLSYTRMSVERDGRGRCWTDELEEVQLGETPASHNADMRLDTILISKLSDDHAAPGYTSHCAYQKLVFISTHLAMEDHNNTVWNLSLEMYRISPLPDHRLTQRCLYSFHRMFAQLIMSEQAPPYEVVLVVFIVAQREVGSNDHDSVHQHRVLASTVNLVFCLVHLRPTMPLQHRNLFRRVVVDLVRPNPVGNLGWTPLHVACSHVRSKVAAVAWFEVVELLLDVGANARAVDRHGNSPLHLLATSSPVRHDLIRLLLGRGAHFDTRNVEGNRFTQLLPAGERDRYRPLDYVSLQCLAATQVFNSVHAHDPALPPHVRQFIDLH